GDDINPKIFNGDEYIHVDRFSYVDESVEEEYYDTSHPKEFEITEHWYDEQQNKQSNADDILQDYEEPQDIAKQPVLHVGRQKCRQADHKKMMIYNQPENKAIMKDDFYEKEPGDHNIRILHHRLRRLPEVRDLYSVTNLKDLDENPASTSLGECSLLTELKTHLSRPPSKNFAEAITFEKDTNISRGGSVSHPKRSKRTTIHTHHTATTEPNVGQGPTIAKQFCLIERDLLMQVWWEELVQVSWINNSNVEKDSNAQDIRKETKKNVKGKIQSGTIIIAALKEQVTNTKTIFRQLIGSPLKLCLHTLWKIDYQQCIMILIFEKKCLQLSNFATLNQILLGLQSPPVERLRRTWSRVRVAERHILKELNDYVSPFDNWKIVRDAMCQIVEDYSVIKDKTKQRRRRSSDKHRTTTAIIKRVIAFQSLACGYTFPIDSDLYAKGANLKAVEATKLMHCDIYMATLNKLVSITAHYSQSGPSQNQGTSSQSTSSQDVSPQGTPPQSIPSQGVPSQGTPP
ncbi:23159_t:CDS:10, partial [Gigaspora margarita]